MVAIFLVVLAFCGVRIWAMARERDAGYTSLYCVHRELWQLDPRTGEVLRPPA